MLVQKFNSPYQTIANNGFIIGDGVYWLLKWLP